MNPIVTSIMQCPHCGAVTQWNIDVHNAFESDANPIINRTYEALVHVLGYHSIDTDCRE